MEPERRRSPRVAVDGDGGGGVLKGLVPVAVRDLSSGGLRLSLGAALEMGAVYPLTLFLRGLSVAAPIRVTRCRPSAPVGWEAGAEFVFRDVGDAGTVRRWTESRTGPVP